MFQQYQEQCDLQEVAILLTCWAQLGCLCLTHKMFQHQVLLVWLETVQLSTDLAWRLCWHPNHHLLTLNWVCNLCQTCSHHPLIFGAVLNSEWCSDLTEAHPQDIQKTVPEIMRTQMTWWWILYRQFKLNKHLGYSIRIHRGPVTKICLFCLSLSPLVRCPRRVNKGSDWLNWVTLLSY